MLQGQTEVDRNGSQFNNKVYRQAQYAWIKQAQNDIKQEKYNFPIQHLCNRNYNNIIFVVFRYGCRMRSTFFQTIRN